MVSQFGSMVIAALSESLRQVLQRQGTGRLEGLDREVAANVAHARQPEQGFGEKALVVAQVGDDHVQEEIRFAGYQKGGNDLGERQHGQPEIFRLHLVVSLDLDPDEHRQAQPYGFRLQAGLIALDHTRLFQLTNTPQAG